MTIEADVSCGYTLEYSIYDGSKVEDEVFDVDDLIFGFETSPGNYESHSSINRPLKFKAEDPEFAGVYIIDYKVIVV